jgi:hypothetical protein
MDADQGRLLSERILSLNFCLIVCGVVLLMQVFCFGL